MFPDGICAARGPVIRTTVGCSPLVVEELAVEGDDDAVSAGVGAPGDVELEIDGRHDAVAELLVVQVTISGQGAVAVNQLEPYVEGSVDHMRSSRRLAHPLVEVGAGQGSAEVETLSVVAS